MMQSPPASPLLQRPAVSRLSQTFGASTVTELCEPSYMFPLTWHFVQGFIGKLRKFSTFQTYFIYMLVSFLAFFVRKSFTNIFIFYLLFSYIFAIDFRENTKVNFREIFNAITKRKSLFQS
jgi:hypothetical protein